LRWTWGPLCLLCRLATSVPPPGCHKVRYAAVLARASEGPGGAGGAERYRPWTELPSAQLPRGPARLSPRPGDRMKMLAIVEDSASIARHLAAEGEPVEVPRRSPSRGPPYEESRVLGRRSARLPAFVDCGFSGLSIGQQST
jgi:hypothetical protein